MKKIVGISILVAAIIAFTVVLAYLFFFMPNNRVVPAFEEGRLNLVVEGEVVEAKEQPKIVDESIMLPFNTVKKYLDPNIYWDASLKKVTVTTKDKVIRMKTDKLDAMINNRPVNLKLPVAEEDGIVYIPIEFLSDFYKIDITYIKASNAIVIDFRNSVKQIAELIKPQDKNAVLRKGHTIKYPIVKKLDVDQDGTGNNYLRVFEEHDKWYKVRAADGTVGYIEKRFVTVKKIEDKPAQEEKKYQSEWKPAKGKINLVWEIAYGYKPELSKIKKMDGLDVLSPTWFHIVNEKGTVNNEADKKYIDWAHKNGYRVWALINNDVEPGVTKKILNNTDTRDNVIRQVLAYTSLYKLDGLNIDFENIYKEDKDALTQFVREITPFLKEQGLVVSIDVTVPDGSENWSQCYDRKALGEIVDYVALMAYDQHWATSPKAGSVAQLSWVEYNLKKTITMVPPEKLLLGLPFYVRIWKEEKSADGKIKVSSPKAVSMEEADKLIKENKAKVTWDEESGQFYAEYQKDGAAYKMWMEEKNSIDLKSSLVQKYKLAGSAAWRRNFEMQDIWEVLNKNLKEYKSYEEWQVGNKGRKYLYN